MRPIETAPKDGSEILAFIPGSRLGGLQEEPDVWEVVFWKPGQGGWRHRGDDHLHLNPTHWTPLPKDTPEPARPKITFVPVVHAQAGLIDTVTVQGAGAVDTAIVAQLHRLQDRYVGQHISKWEQEMGR